MRVLTCVVQEHDHLIVALAALMCLIGSFVSVKLIQRALTSQGMVQVQWSFLAAVTGGAAIWATHFIAMLGYRPGAPVTLDGTLTIMSAIIAVIGIALGLMVSSIGRGRAPALVGGGLIGLAIAAMHYVGMFAYRVEGIVHWQPSYVIGSIVLSVVFAAWAIGIAKRSDGESGLLPATACLVTAIITLHFTGMAAFTVTPISGFAAGVDSDAFSALAAAIAMIAFLIVGAGIATHLVERRIYSDSQEQLEHIAHHDALTQVANRHAFSLALAEEHRKFERYGRPFALMLVDLDRFKQINDTLGHPTGDEVLRAVSKRLNVAVREGDLVARIGGDEFAVIAHGVGSAEQASAIAARIVEILDRPFVVNGNVAEIGGSVGIALVDGETAGSDELVQHADLALYTAKHKGRSCYCLFDPVLNEAVRRRRSLEADLRRASMREDFRVVYQPITDTSTGEITGAEALVRWSSSEWGEVPPSEFIPIAEELGVVSRIGAFVLRRACADAAAWPRPLNISVNISPVQLLDPRLPQVATQALSDSGLAPERLELEITETALLGNDELAMRTLTKLCELGIRISLDDFGTGYSSLSYLHRFPISRIKIDKSFVQRLPEDLGSVSIVRAIAQLGESLDLLITAEGIETDAQLAFIAEHGCEHVQGFLIGHPVASEDFARLVSARHQTEAA